MMNLNVYKRKLYSLGIATSVFIILLHFICGVYAEEKTISADQDYYLATGDTAVFNCAQGGKIKVLQYSGTSAAQESTTEVDKATGSNGKWECTKAFGESAAQSPNIVPKDGKSYVLAFNKFECAATGDPTANVYCEVVKSDASSSSSSSTTTAATNNTNSAILPAHGNSIFYGVVAASSLYLIL